MNADRILVVEDEYVLAASLDADLKAMGYRVVGMVPSGRQALEAAAQDPPDLAVMDIRLKGEMDGTEAALRLKREYGVPAIFLTAYSDECFLDRAKRCEPLGYLLKPYTREELRAALEVGLYKAREERRLEIERRHLQAQRLETIGVLAAGIAHNFNNLLGVVVGGLDLTLLQMPAGGPLRRTLDQALQASIKARDLVRHLLEYAGKGQHAPQTFDLNALVRAKLSFLKSALPDSVELNLRLAPGALLIRADPAGVEQILMNLVMNASDSYGPQAGAVSLAIGSQRCDEGCFKNSRIDSRPSAGNYACIEVSDAGCGMDAETNRRLFEPFFSTKLTGRGLGMAALRGIVQTHCGAIFVMSAPDRGTTVRVLLPVPAL